IREVIKKYPERFFIDNHTAAIPYDQLSLLKPEDLSILRKHDVFGLGVSAIVLLGIAGASFALNFFQVQVMESAGQQMMHDLRMTLFAQIQQQTIPFFTKNPVGRLVTRVTNDVQNMHELFTSVVVVVFKDLFLLFGIAVVLVVINWKLAIISFTVLPFVAFASFKFSNLARDAFRILRVKLAEINTHFAETISGIRVIQAFLHEPENYRRFERLNHENYIVGMLQIKIFAVFMPIIELLAACAVGMIVYYGGGAALSGRISLGALVAFLSYMRMFFNPIRDMAEKYNVMQNAMASAERIFLILDHHETLETVSETMRKESRSPIRISGVKFQNVSFQYSHEEPVLNDISFDVEKGETIAIVGPTGSGKTSLINLIPRFYDPSSGRILINGMDSRKFDLFHLRRRMALVSQDPFLFSGTLYENIVWDQRRIPDPDIDKILNLAQCAQLIERLPMGIHTILSEGGKSLSSGERQLISIARAFACDPDLIILDEATSYVDSQTEKRLQNALYNLMAHKTCILIAHRLSTARHANRILVLNRGRIVESGTHQSLMRKQGYYYRLYQLQNPETPSAGAKAADDGSK
ncbi:MAG: ABC transporter, partial [Deltaproteobacteria bacterium RBG_13_49_15]